MTARPDPMKSGEMPGHGDARERDREREADDADEAPSSPARRERIPRRYARECGRDGRFAAGGPREPARPPSLPPAQFSML